MSLELHVFVSDSRMADARQWQEALSEIDAELRLPKDFSTRISSGFLPVRLKGRKSGFEYFFGAVDPSFSDLSDELGDRDRMITFVPRGELGLTAAMWAAAALARCGHGLFHDPQDGQLIDADGVLEIARKSKIRGARAGDEIATDSEENKEDLDAASRQARKGDAFDRTLDVVITPIMAAQGFSEERPYLFTRIDAGGQDIIDFVVYDDFFYVALGYVPAYMEEINRLFDPAPRSRAPGILRLLAPAVIVRGGGKKLYRLSSPKKTEQSIRLVKQGLVGIGFRWLQTLRDRSVYATELHAIHPICIARAWEAAGNTDAARAAYQQELADDIALRSHFESQEEFAKSWIARTLVYSGLKLQLELELCSQLMRSGGFRLEVEPMPLG